MAYLHKIEYSKVKTIWLLRSEEHRTLATAKLFDGEWIVRVPGGELLGFASSEGKLLEVARQLEEVGVNYREVYL